MMTPERWQQVKDVFQAALEHDPGERAAFLDAACAGDAELRNEVETLLVAHEEAGSFIDAPVFEATVEAAQPETGSMVGRRIGPYQLIREIGRGGMGAVYLALRADEQYRKRVAVKLLKRGMETDFILRRFRQERQILASLDHPNIARLLDGGTTEDGLPYFVMEYIEGTPIDQYCDRHKLTTEERLELFRQVCSAVHYAHQNLVVHRDLKPSNMLVTTDGVPKLLDFGIAKLLNPELAAASPATTATALRLMTPEYASPEQVRGEPITTASDVYSLGVVLYELLSGHRPYRLSGQQPYEIMQVVCQEEPAKPSTAVGRDHKEQKAKSKRQKAKIEFEDDAVRNTPYGQDRLSTEQISVRRRTTAEKLRRRLKGDLDNIVLMAMRKEPGRRYASVEQFSEDIRRHLEGLPVMARKDTMSYRAGKFIRRHKLGMIAAGLILMALLVGMATTLWQAGLAKAQQARAERRFNDVRKLAHSLLFELHDAIRDLPGATPARELLVKRALTYLDSLAQEAGDDLALQRDLATAYDRVGDIQGNPYSANLGDTAGALQSYQRALAIRRALAAADPTDVETQRGLAASYMNIGDILEVTGERTSALQSYRRALAIRKALVAQSPSDKQARLDLAQSYDTMGHTLTKMADLDGALEHLRQAVAIREALAREDPSSIPARRGLAVSYDQIGFIMALRDDAAKALQNYRKALTLRLALSAENPDNATIRRELSYSYNSIGDMLWATNDLTGALEQYRQAVTIGEALAAKDPTNRQSRRDLAISLSNVGNTLAWLGEKTGALENSHTSLAIFQALAAEDAGKAEAQRDLALAYSNLADVWAVLAARPAALTRQRIERWRQARSWYQRSLDVWLKLRQQGTLSRLDANKPDRARQNIAKCDAALARLKGR